MESDIMHLHLLDGGSVPTAELQAFVERTIEKANVTGLSCAIINDGQVVYRHAFGVRNTSTGARNDEETVFGAASFSKRVFAYLVLQPTALLQIKLEDGKLWMLSMGEGKSWNPLYAETETRFHAQAEETDRYEFIRDKSGNVTGLRMEYLGIPFPVAPKVKWKR